MRAKHRASAARRIAILRKQTRLSRSPERVWKALTDHRELSRWLLPIAEDIEPRIGYRFAFRDSGGKRIACEVVAAEPGRSLTYTWQQESDPAPTLVTWTLTPSGPGTLLTLEHEGKGAEGMGITLAALRASLEARVPVCLRRSRFPRSAASIGTARPLQQLLPSKENPSGFSTDGGGPLSRGGARLRYLFPAAQRPDRLCRRAGR